MRIRLRAAQTLTGLSGQTLRKYAKEGRVNAVRIGNQWRFDQEDLEALMRDGDTGRKAARAHLKRERGRVERERSAAYRAAVHAQSVTAAASNDKG